MRASLMAVAIALGQASSPETARAVSRPMEASLERRSNEIERECEREAPVLSSHANSSARRVRCGRPFGDASGSNNASGTLRTLSASGDIDTDNPFFQSLGTNGRSCVTCHSPDAAWTVTPAGLSTRFEASAGQDPIFRVNDGSNSPLADVSTIEARRKAYSMLLGKAVIRVGLPMPAGAEFSLERADDPYGFASAAELSLFRRPLPATNLRFLTGVMWDDRETRQPFAPPMDAGAAMSDLLASFRNQAANATLGHAQAAAAPTDMQLQQIVAFELGLSTAQARDRSVGMLSDGDGLGGPRVLANLQFHVGINDLLGADPVPVRFSVRAMRLFEAWQPQRGVAGDTPRNAIARGEQVFNSRPFAISAVSGLNDAADALLIAGTCTSCHDTPNVGNHSVGRSMDIGTTDASRRTADMPLYTLRNLATGAQLQTTDPGRALITGKWTDIGKFKTPVLRGLAARAPYFHNGMAASLDEVIDFYESRFGIGLNLQERRDLVAFLKAL